MNGKHCLVKQRRDKQKNILRSETLLYNSTLFKCHNRRRAWMQETGNLHASLQVLPSGNDTITRPNNYERSSTSNVFVL